jgi:hypothetical protein
MTQNENAAYPSSGEEREKKKKWLLPLFLLLLLTLATSCIVGYLLGKNAGPQPLGQIIDTILLGPDETEARTRMHLTGRVLYSDGSPAAGRTLELHSDPIKTVTDRDGRFLFANVPFGEHRILVRGQDGSVAAERSIYLSQDSEEEGVSIFQQDGSYEVTVALDVRVLELVVELDGDTLSLFAEEYSYANEDGWVTTPGGAVSIQRGVIVTPEGNVHLPDGTIVIPNREEGAAAVILPDDTVIYPKTSVITGGYTIQPDGTVELADGTKIKPGGNITVPGGEVQTPGKSGVIVDGSTVTPIGGRRGDTAETGSPEQTANSKESPPAENTNGSNRPVKPGNPTDSSEPANPSESGESISPSESGEQTSPSESDEPTSPSEPSEPTSPSESSEPTSSDDPDEGKLNVAGERENSGNYLFWTQSSTIDLFYNRTSGFSDLVAPGSSGFYCFRLQNTRVKGLDFALTLTEGEIPLPVEITLTPLDSEGKKITEKAVSGAVVNGTLKLEGEIEAEGQITYRMDWEWPYEGNDAADTRIGEAGGIYTLLLTIDAAEK